MANDLLEQLASTDCPPVPVEFEEISRPQYPAQWREVNVITIAYGHGIAVSPLHVATAVSAIVNGGIMYRPTFLKLSPGAHPPRATTSRAYG